MWRGTHSYFYYICIMQIREESVDQALQLLNDRYEAKMKGLGHGISTIHTSHSESDLCTTSYSAQEMNSDLCGGSYTSLTDSDPLCTSTPYTATDAGICAMASS
jgi:hypothetical protein